MRATGGWDRRDIAAVVDLGRRHRRLGHSFGSGAGHVRAHAAAHEARRAAEAAGPAVRAGVCRRRSRRSRRAVLAEPGRNEVEQAQGGARCWKTGARSAGSIPRPRAGHGACARTRRGGSAYVVALPTAELVGGTPPVHSRRARPCSDSRRRGAPGAAPSLMVSLIVQFIVAGSSVSPATGSGTASEGSRYGALRPSVPAVQPRGGCARSVEGLRMASPVNHQPMGLAHPEQT